MMEGGVADGDKNGDGTNEMNSNNSGYNHCII